jgi:hypothetical protein
MAFDCHPQFLSSPVDRMGTGVGRRREGRLSPDLHHINASSKCLHQVIPSDYPALGLVELPRLLHMFSASFHILHWIAFFLR